jgi:magnesium-transporting ATPase (P-type)
MAYSGYTIDEVFKTVNSSEKGLKVAEASIKLREYGKNILEEKKKASPLRIFFATVQFAGSVDTFSSLIYLF